MHYFWFQSTPPLWPSSLWSLIIGHDVSVLADTILCLTWVRSLPCQRHSDRLLRIHLDLKPHLSATAGNQGTQPHLVKQFNSAWPLNLLHTARDFPHYWNNCIKAQRLPKTTHHLNYNTFLFLSLVAERLSTFRCHIYFTKNLVSVASKTAIYLVSQEICIAVADSIQNDSLLHRLPASRWLTVGY